MLQLWLSGYSDGGGVLDPIEKKVREIITKRRRTIFPAYARLTQELELANYKNQIIEFAVQCSRVCYEQGIQDAASSIQLGVDALLNEIQ